MNGAKILVVEDEVFIAHDIKRILDSEGYTTFIDCFNVDMAIQFVLENRPDLVLIDINLGDRKSGLDLAEYLDKIVVIPYIFITSYSDKPTLKKVSEHYPSGYITKPFKPQDLITAVFLVIHKRADSVEGAWPEKEIPFAITRVIHHIEQNLREKLDLKVLAALTDWEPEHFGRIFKEKIGMTPYQFVLKSKIDRAKELLTRTEEPVQTICFELGFSSYTNFFKAFKKYVKMSPEHFRKLTR